MTQQNLLFSRQRDLTVRRISTADVRTAIINHRMADIEGCSLVQVDLVENGRRPWASALDPCISGEDSFLRGRSDV